MILIPPPVAASYPVPSAWISVSGEHGYYAQVAAADGTFLFDNSLPAGNYTAVVGAPGFMYRKINLTIVAGQTTNLGDILLNPSARIEGRVVGPGGAPIPNVALLLQKQDNSSTSYAVSDQAGNFVFNENISTGTYRISSFFAEGYIDGTLQGISVVEGQTTSNVTLQLARSAVIAGTVKGFDNTPIPGAIVLVSSPTVYFMGSGTTDSNGFFNISNNIPTGTYNVSVLYGEFPGYIYSDLDPKQVSAVAGQTSTVNFVLERSASISGTVTYSDGTPAEGVNVFAMGDGGYADAETDEYGHYTINRDLRVGDYTVMADYDYFNSKEVSITEEGQAVAGIDFVIEGSPPKKGYISGTVTSSGSPIEGAEVYANRTFLDFSRANGTYLIEVEWTEEGDTAVFNVTAEATGYYAASRFPVTVTAGDTTPGVDFSLTKIPTGSLAGRVVSGIAPPKQSATLTIQYSPTGTTLRAGDMVTITGSLNPPRSGPATLYWSINSSGFIHFTNETITSGSFSRNFWFESGPGEYAIKLVWAGDDLYYSAESNVLTISVLPAQVQKQNATLTLQPSASSATVGSTVTLSGTILPSQSGTVSLYYSINGSTAALLSNTTLSGGTFSYIFNLSQVGTYLFYAYWPGNEGYNSAWSQNVTVVSQAPQPQKTTPTVTISASKTSVTLDANHTSEVLTITGTISPFVSATTMNIKVTNPDNQVATIPITVSSSSFSANFTVNKAGTWKVQAQVPEGDVYNSANSNTVTVTAQMAQAAGGGDNTLLFGGVAIVVIAALAGAFLLLRRKK
ncbi:MAG: carboxypeptidase-like regulatory domain-containing protein [Candidatus Verstraetearchaeota archaeon]|nr:carboxypeptidase-like regulatory domain-containing protein [Candidatus Verstraetearchaeota archaeon]